MTKFPMRLVSDYYDIYDAWFDLEGPVFERRSKPPAGFSKPEQFRLLKERFGLMIPQVGYVNETSWRSEKLVVYTDDYLHAGNGKELLDVHKALLDRSLQSRFASEFIPSSADPENFSRSTKLLFIGEHEFKISVTCRGDWRTNSGDLTVEVVDYKYRRNDFLALFAIDFVIGLDGDEFAVDLNTAPGLMGLGIDEYLKPREIAESIKEWCYRNGQARKEG